MYYMNFENEVWTCVKHIIRLLTRIKMIQFHMTSCFESAATERHFFQSMTGSHNLRGLDLFAIIVRWKAGDVCHEWQLIEGYWSPRTMHREELCEVIFDFTSSRLLGPYWSEMSPENMRRIPDYFAWRRCKLV